MTNDLQIAVVKAMGWKLDYSGPLSSEHWKDRNGYIYDQPPPLTLDLMWDLEQAMNNEELIAYDKALNEILREGSRVSDFSAYPGDFVWHASKEQRAKAWLKVKGVEL